METITKTIYEALDEAFNFFNRELFFDQLPVVAITLQKSRRAYGYFSKSSFRNRQGTTASEIALNPEYFLERTDKQILGTLAHEMCHAWQHAFGRASRNGYHNKEFAKKMKSIGLIASSTGDPGGKQTGQNMSHYVEQGGLFDRKCDQLIKHELILWGSFQQRYVGLQIIDRTQDLSLANNKDTSKTKFTCPTCKQNAWARSKAKLICGACKIEMQSTF